MKIRSIFLLLAAVTVATMLATIILRNRQAMDSDRDADAVEKQEAGYALEAWRWYNFERAFPTGHVPLDWRESAFMQLRGMSPPKGRRFGLSSIAWNSVGPTNIAGRARSIAIDTVNHILYSGSVSGGIWRSTDAGNSWMPLTDSTASNLVIGCLAIDPSNPSVIYAGTGEGYFNVDALRGVGILKSTNAGVSWSILSNFVAASSPVAYINKIVIDPVNTSVLYAAVSSVDVGIWKSTDAGTSWSKLSAGGAINSGTLKFCTDLVMDPTNSGTLYGAFGLFNSNGIYKTTNAGLTWSKLTNGFPATSTKFTRISIAIAPSNPQVLYACLADSNYYTHSILKSADGGASWTAVSVPFDTDPLVNNTHLGGQGWYNNVIAVDPTNANTVLTGGINMFRSTDGGSQWTRISDGNAGGMHVDQHAIVFDPSNLSTVYAGNDGGIFKSVNSGVNFVAVNTGLTTAQFYSGAVHPTSETYYGGTQDNGTLKSGTVPSWNEIFSGDGGVTLVDPVNPSNVFTEYVYLAIQKSTNGGTTFTRSIQGIPQSGSNQGDGTSDRCAFIAPFAMDPSNSQNLVAGTYRVFRSTTGGLSWNPISTDITGDGAGAVRSSGSVITALSVARTSSSTIYAGTSGYDTLSSRVVVTTNTGSTWTNVTRSPLPDRVVRAISINPSNGSDAVAAFSGYNGNTPSTPGHIFRTTNRGTSWTDISGNLPDVPSNALLLDSTNTNHIMTGTDIGIFETTDGGSTWISQNSGMANVSVADIDLRPDGYVFAATHGRGMFKSSVPFGVSSAALSIIIHQNSVLSQFVDLFVTSAESLSSSPSISVAVGSKPSQLVSMVQNSYRVYKGSYQFSSSGSTLLTCSAQDSLGRTIISYRSFQTQLLKAGTGGIISTPDHEVTLSISGTALPEDTYFTVIPEHSASMALLGPSYTFGPEREFNSSVAISFSYTDDQLGGRNPLHLAIMKFDGSSWNAVQSLIDPAHRTVTARVSTLGEFALGYDENSIHSSVIPGEMRLKPNYPNPFNPSTQIEFDLSGSANVRLEVFDVNGRLVNVLVDGNLEAGNHVVRWDGTSFSGDRVASGIYFDRLLIRKGQAMLFQKIEKMCFMK
ncbi:MAG TPA: FlgD immunoglobulin-like domain containing protein [Bacteroidota bacterium]|nr:FlgD immunoglobulin-like domain containing protein [Bacteroidota bacterium]